LGRGYLTLKILRRDVKHGRITLIPEVLDDLWILYNVISRGDEVYAKTTREVRFGERYDRPEKGKRISVYMGIRVERVGWDRTLNRLRVHGIICDAPEKVGALGSHHTINVTLNKPLTIIKRRWPKYQLERIEKATRFGISPLIIVSIDDEGYCIAILREFGIDVKVEERVNLPSKREAEMRTSALKGFFNSALRALRSIWEAERNSIVLLGLGFIKKDFLEYLREKAPDLARSIIDVKSVNSSGLAGINEALRSGILKRALRHLRISEETDAVEDVLTRIGKGRGDVTYGFEEVKRVVELGAVERLLLTDRMIREAPEEERLKLEELMRRVEETGGRVIIVSTEHEAGVKLSSLGGIAALLRFPIE